MADITPETLGRGGLVLPSSAEAMEYGQTSVHGLFSWFKTLFELNSPTFSSDRHVPEQLVVPGDKDKKIVIVNQHFDRSRASVVSDEHGRGQANISGYMNYKVSMLNDGSIIPAAVMEVGKRLVSQTGQVGLCRLASDDLSCSFLTGEQWTRVSASGIEGLGWHSNPDYQEEYTAKSQQVRDALDGFVDYVS